MRFKVIMVGEGHVGKTTLINRHMTGQFETKYVPTQWCSTYELAFDTNHGKIIFDLMDLSGQYRFDDNILGAEGIIGVADLTDVKTAEALLTDKWYEQLYVQCLPSVVCGNKVDLVYHQGSVSNSMKQALKNKWSTYYDISAKSNYNFDKPFLYLARKLTRINDLEFM